MKELERRLIVKQLNKILYPEIPVKQKKVNTFNCLEN